MLLSPTRLRSPPSFRMEQADAFSSPFAPCERVVTRRENSAPLLTSVGKKITLHMGLTSDPENGVLDYILVPRRNSTARARSDRWRAVPGNQLFTSRHIEGQSWRTKRQFGISDI
jgi:hypothetical protein